MNKNLNVILVHGGLFLLTLITTTMAGAEWTYSKSVFMPGYSWADFQSGFAYSIPFLLTLTVHEFGHYFTAQYYRIKVSLPYYIPLPPLFMLGTLGAVIRLRERPVSKQQHFDIGIAGPLAGFVVAVVCLWYGFTHLPPADYIFQFHPEYARFGADYAAYVYRPEFMKEGVVDVVVGKNLLFLFFERFVADPALVPNPHEIMHYPLLFAGFLTLVFTSLNLLPIGQLDGGHILYGLVGYDLHRKIASTLFVVLLFFAGLGLFTATELLHDLWWETLKIVFYIGFLYVSMTGLGFAKKDTLLYAVAMFTAQYVIAQVFPMIHGYPGWLLFAFVTGRLVGIRHPPSDIEGPLTLGRKIAGWLALVILVICFTPNPLDLIETAKAAP
jgi:membrane-associated protease RseP (regulator of RpoE activity)